MGTLDDLVKQFERFPGVGVRQAKRFAFHILTLPESERSQLARNITNLDSSVTACSKCHRYFSPASSSQTICNICNDPNRDTDSIMVVAHDSDIDAIERSGVYQGQYFVLGGTVPLLQQAPAKIRGAHLLARAGELITTENNLEVILGFAINPDGENTARYVEQLLAQKLESTSYTTRQLGRGLSTGSELEYADPETIRTALMNRQ